MSKYRVLSLWILVITLTACSSLSDEPLKYYTLDGVSQLPQEPDVPERIIVFKSLTLAEYLQQSYLTFQSESHQLYIASQHIWAENLHTAIQKVMLNELNQNDSRIVFIKDSDPRARTATEFMGIDIEHLLATTDKSVKLSARYWLNMPKEKINKVGVSNIESPLQNSGYASAVKEMRQSLTVFAREIKSSLKQWSGQ